MGRFHVGWVAPRALFGFLLSSVLLLVAVGAVAAQAPQGGTLTVVAGTAAVVPSSGPAQQPARSGANLGVGDQVGTLASSVALVTFFEGSELELGENSNVIMREIRASGNEVHLTVEQVLGTTTNRIKAFVNPSSTYELRDPSGRVVALARGSEIRGRRTDDGTFSISYSNCNVPPGCEIRVDNAVVSRGVQGGGVINPNFAFVEQRTEGQFVPEPNTRNAPTGGKPEGGATDDEAADDDDEEQEDGDPKDDHGGYSYQGPTPLTSEMLRSRLGQDLDGLAATGGMLALGMIGWTAIGGRRRHD